MHVEKDLMITLMNFLKRYVEMKVEERNGQENIFKSI